jgi:hypothetical protein
MQQQEMIKAGIAPNPQEVQEEFDMGLWWRRLMNSF